MTYVHICSYIIHICVNVIECECVQCLNHARLPSIMAPSSPSHQASLKVICIPALLSSNRQAMVTSTQPQLVRPGAKQQVDGDSMALMGFMGV